MTPTANATADATQTGTPATITLAVPAAGCGARAALNGNKILAPLQGRPLLWWTLRALTDPTALPPLFQLQEVLIAARRDEWPLVEAALPDETRARTRLVEGGATRQESVASLAREAGSEWILVHDAARPLVRASVMARVCTAARQTGAALAALPASDTVKQARLVHDSSLVETTLERASIWLAQTPQVFRRSTLHEALQQAEADGFIGTDCASLVERLRDEAGQPLQPVQLVEGDPLNFKVTFAADLQRAEMLLTKMETTDGHR